MCSKVNISNSKRQVVNKTISPKVSKIHQYRLDIYKLSDKAINLANYLIWEIITNGSYQISQRALHKKLRYSLKGVNEALKKLERYGVIRQKYTKQIKDLGKKGRSIYVFGRNWNHIQKCEILASIIPSYNFIHEAGKKVMKKAWESGNKLLTERLTLTHRFSQKQGLTVLRDFRNKYLNIQSLSTTNTLLYKEGACARRKSYEKLKQPPEEKPPVKIVKRTEEEIVQEREKRLSMAKERNSIGFFLRSLGKEISEIYLQRFVADLPEKKYV